MKIEHAFMFRKDTKALEDFQSSEDMVINQVKKELNRLYDINLGRGYDIKKIVKQDDEFFLGCFDEDILNCQYIADDFESGVCNKPSEILSFSKDTQIVEIYENGLICRDLPSDSTYYFSTEALNRFKEADGFPLDIRESYNLYRTSPLKVRAEQVDIADGLDSNRLKDNLRKSVCGQCYYNHYNQYETTYRGGYEYQNGVFHPYVHYKSKTYHGRDCDNEVEACCEIYILEQEVVKECDREFLFNPRNNHLNQRHLVEKYIRGEINQRGLLRDTLTDVANNPYLILRFCLVEECRSLCIPIQSFKLSGNGFIVNSYGERYSDFAKLYCNGKLTRDEIYAQHLVQNIQDLSCNN